MKKFRVVLVCLFVIMTMGLTGCGTNYNYESQELTIKHGIKTLEISNETKGEFIHNFSVGYAIVGESTYYYVYVEEKPGKYLLKKYDAENTYICEDVGQPRIESTYKYISIKAKEWDKLHGSTILDIVNVTLDGKEARVYYSDNDIVLDATDTRDATEVVVYSPKMNSDIKFSKLSKLNTEDTHLCIRPVSTTLYVPKGTIKVKYDVTLPPTQQ